MDISPACLPPIQPPVPEDAKRHPRFQEYLRYRAGLAALLVEAASFYLWLHNVEENESYMDIVFQTQPGASLAPGWYKHKFAPGHKLIARLGPYASQEEAEAAE